VKLIVDKRGVTPQYRDVRSNNNNNNEPKTNMKNKVHCSTKTGTLEGTDFELVHYTNEDSSEQFGIYKKIRSAPTSILFEEYTSKMKREGSSILIAKKTIIKRLSLVWDGRSLQVGNWEIATK
jgi:hypothetical protein